MNFVETEGKNIDEAIRKACEQLNVSREDLEIEVLSDASSGFLGLVGAKKAQIRATIKETAAGQSTPTSSLTPHPSSVEAAQKTLLDLLGFLGVNAAVEVKEEEERVLLEIKGDGSGLLIGRKGQTIDALEYLLNKIVHKDNQEKKRIVVDTENYRARREESLDRMARRLADKAKRLGRAVTISPMNAHDRRIIHKTLQDDKDLRTWSTGTGVYRKVVISPEKRAS